MQSPTPNPLGLLPPGKTGRGCLTGLGCAVLTAIVWWCVIGLAALRILRII